MVASSTQPKLLRFGPNWGHRDASTPIGLVDFTTHRGEPAEAILDSTGAWNCPKLPVLDRVLNALFAPHRTGDIGQPFGQAELTRVAAWIKGEVRSAQGRKSFEVR